jgi:hypothetical protein
MALVQCPECGQSVSSAAATCPQCAYPMHQSGTGAGRLNPKHTGRIITTERTGKGLKFQKLLAALLMFSGVITWIVGASDPRHKQQGVIVAGVCMVAFSLVWYLYIRAAAWWRHG